MTNREILEKADLAVSNLETDGGYLNPMQANQFIRDMINQPTLLGQVRVVPMNAPTMEINKIGFADRILKAAPDAGTALGASDRSKPTTDKVELTTKEVIAEVHIPYDVLEDNIERGTLEDTIMDLIAERASLDLEELIILGDTGSGDAFLALFDGVLEMATSHVVDYTDGVEASVDRGLFKNMLKAMPNPYLRNRSAMRFYVSPHAEIEYADSLASRATSMGDAKNVADYAGNMCFGVPVAAAALMSNDKAIFTYPKNIIFGVQRQIMIETDRDIRARVLVVVLTMRLAIQLEEEDAVVKALGIDVGEGPTTT